MDWEMTLRNEWTKGHDVGVEEGKAIGKEEGEAIGIEKGKAEGTLEVLMSLVKDGFLTIQEAASRSGLTETEFKKKLADYSAAL